MGHSAGIDFYPPAQVCFHAARYSEKMIKAKLALCGIHPERIHYQDKLLNLLPDFDGKERALAMSNTCPIMPLRPFILPVGAVP